jgi:hypothetical protein
VVFVVGQIVSGLEPTESAQVIELLVRARDLQLFARGGKISGVALKEQGREAGGAVRRGQAHDASFSAGAKQVRVGPAINLRTLDGRGGERAEVNLIAQIAGVDSVKKDLAVDGTAAADKQRSLRAHLPFRHNFSSRHQPQNAGEVRTQRKIDRGQHRGRFAGLWLRRGHTSRRHHDGFAHPRGLQNQIALDGIELACIEIWCLQLSKALGRNHEEETARASGRELEAAIGRRDR